MSEPMIERVAKALSDGEWDAEDFTKTLSGDEPEEMRSYWRAKAETAIRAMMEPTPAMCEFAEDNFERNADNIAVCWRAFVTAALSSPPSKS